jgi:type I restriction enzyme S subunit
MNADRLLAHYQRIADAPDAIPRLRRFVLDLAVRGKLVLQELNEPLAKRYSDEPSSDDLPSNWRLLNFGKFCDIEGGNQPPKSRFISEAKEGYIRLLQIRDLGERLVPTFIPIGSTNRFCKEGEILIGRYGASVGKIFWAQDGAYNVALTKFIWPEDAFVASFAFLLLKSEYFQGHVSGATRSAQAGFNKGDLAEINFPLPPLSEQGRIVAKVDELMALCARLEAARADREAMRDRFTVASLGRLNTPDPDSFRDDVRFALDRLPALTARPCQINQLRQTVLNLAVRGKLVPQDPGDEPASELLKQIATEKARLVKSGEIRNFPAPLNVKNDEQPFDLPGGWRWVRLSDVLTKLTDGTHHSPPNEPFGDIKYITAKNIKDEGASLADVTYVSRKVHEEIYSRCNPAKGDILYIKDGATTGIVTINDLEEPFSMLSSVALLKLPSCLFNRLIVMFLRSPFFYDQMRGFMKGAAITRVTLKRMGPALVPLPPLAEQHRIVARVDELMARCDQLEASLTTADEARSCLLDALLAEALTPDDERELEAAE